MLYLLCALPLDDERGTRPLLTSSLTGSASALHRQTYISIRLGSWKFLFPSISHCLRSLEGGKERGREGGREGGCRQRSRKFGDGRFTIVRSSRKGSARGERGRQRGGGAEQAAKVPNRCKVRRRQRPPPISIPQHLATLVSGERVRVEFIATGREKRTPFDGTSLTS